MNAVKHGLTAKTVLLPDEDPHAFERFATALEDDLQPVGAIESVLLERLTLSAWRLRRAARIEAEMLTDHRQEDDGSSSSLGLGFVRAMSHSDAVNALARHERALERGLLAMLRELRNTPPARGESAAATPGAEEPSASKITSDHVVAAPDADG